MKTFWSIILLAVMSLQLFGCAAQEAQTTQTDEITLSALGTVDFMRDVQPMAVSAQDPSAQHAQAAADFAVSLLQNSYSGENCILSPYSVYMALAMTANGADAQTLEQMQNVLGMSADELNDYLYTLSSRAGEEILCANSIWFRHNTSFAPKADFLQTNASYYGAGAYGADFDAKTLEDINAWVSEHTNGRIEKLLDKIDPMAVMYLLNALTFDADWEKEYFSTSVSDGIFHAASGEQTVSMMHSTENRYLQDALATGFMKDYMGGRYSYVALLPNEGVSMADYLASLSGEGLLSTIANASQENVIASMPQCKLEYKTELSEILSAMGMSDAFSNAADFSRLSNSELKLGKVVHQTYLSVNPKGTQAGAATSVEIMYKGIPLMQKSVTLDRPFVMGIYDNVNGCFIFLGAVNSVA
ncbi:MAG: serine protease [Ruminococcaceae bacterium]|nr:serine protease [Oscillospiraceae bacterium]